MAEKSIKNFLRFAAGPLILLGLFLSFLLIYRLFGLPLDDEWITIAERFFLKNLYLTVFLGAVVEGLLLINWYLPGSIIIVFGIVFARNNGESALLVLILVMIAFFITCLINYALGKYGWYRLLLRFGLEHPLERAKQKTSKTGLRIILTTYFHPNFGALIATSAGILHYSFRKFVLYSLAAIVGWNTLWGTITYFLGPTALKFVTFRTLFAVLVIWLIYLAVIFYKKRGLIDVPPNIP